MKMTVKTFIETMTKDIDVYNNVIDGGGVAYCPPLYFTEEGLQEFQEVLQYQINVDEEDQTAWIICDDEEAVIPWKIKVYKAEKLFWSMAGYCSEDDYNKWFVSKDDYYESVEVCPHCGQENVYPMWDVAKQGYIAKCKKCNRKIFLCDECFHNDDNNCQYCNWHTNNKGNDACWRGEIENEPNTHYKFVDFQTFAQIITNAPMNTTFDFTFDQSKNDFCHDEPTGWNGVKLSKLFDETIGVLLIGYYGGGCTTSYDLEQKNSERLMYTTWEMSKQEIVAECLEDYAATYGYGSISKLCVEVTAENKQYFMEVE